MKTRYPCLVLVIAHMLVSCASQPMMEKSAGKDTFHMISDAELHQGMQKMAKNVSAIALLSLDAEMSTEQKQSRIIPLLDEIQAIASGIDGNGSVTNYSVVNRYMGSFLYDVTLARQFANRQPPNLVPSQRLIKSCMACHESI